MTAFGGDWHLQDEELMTVHAYALRPAVNRRPQPAVEHGEEIQDGLFRIAVARQPAAVLDAEQEGAAVGVREGRNSTERRWGRS